MSFDDSSCPDATPFNTFKSLTDTTQSSTPVLVDLVNKASALLQAVTDCGESFPPGHPPNITFTCCAHCQDMPCPKVDEVEVGDSSAISNAFNTFVAVHSSASSQLTDAFGKIPSTLPDNLHYISVYVSSAKTGISNFPDMAKTFMIIDKTKIGSDYPTFSTALRVAGLILEYCYTLNNNISAAAAIYFENCNSAPSSNQECPNDLMTLFSTLHSETGDEPLSSPFFSSTTNFQKQNTFACTPQCATKIMCNFPEQLCMNSCNPAPFSSTLSGIDSDLGKAINSLVPTIKNIITNYPLYLPDKTSSLLTALNADFPNIQTDLATYTSILKKRDFGGKTFADVAKCHTDLAQRMSSHYFQLRLATQIFYLHAKLLHLA